MHMLHYFLLYTFKLHKGEAKHSEETDSWRYPLFILSRQSTTPKKVSEKSRECHNHKPQPFPDPKRKRKPTNLNKHKPNKRTKSTEISSLFPKRGNRNTKRTVKHKNKMTHGKTCNKSPRRINHKATRSKTRVCMCYITLSIPLNYTKDGQTFSRNRQ